jgi:two-component system, NarL family, invasion response regulator UvrY
MRILIVNDHPFLLDALADVMRCSFPCAVVLEASTGRDAISVVQEDRVDVAMLDIGRPDHRGLILLRRIKQVRPSLKCLVLTMYDDPCYMRWALADGASGYLVKPASSEELRDAIRDVLSGRRAMPESFGEADDHRLDRRGARWTRESLSARGRAVLLLLGRGWAVQDVAKRLKLSVKTVVVYQTRLMVKLGLKTTADLIRYAVQHRLG